MLLTITNQSPIFNDEFERVAMNIKKNFKRIGTARNFKMFYAYSSRTQ